MARPTIASLTADLNTARNEQLAAAKALDAARIRIAELEGDVAALKSQLAKAPATAVIKPAYVRVAREPSPEQLAYRAALAQARDFAMRSGKSCTVTRKVAA